MTNYVFVELNNNGTGDDIFFASEADAVKYAQSEWDKRSALSKKNMNIFKIMECEWDSAEEFEAYNEPYSSVELEPHYKREIKSWLSK